MTMRALWSAGVFERSRFDAGQRGGLANQLTRVGSVFPFFGPARKLAQVSSNQFEPFKSVVIEPR